MDIEVCPCAAGSEAMSMRSMTMRAQVMGYEDHGNCEEGRESRYERGQTAQPLAEKQGEDNQCQEV